MEENEMLEQTNESENVETQTTEENVEGIELTDTTETEETQETESEEETEEVRKFTQEEVDEIVKRRLARKEKEYQKELSKYQDTDNVLRSTLQLKDGDDTNTKLREYYESEGIKLPERVKPGLSSRESEILGRADADEFIQDGYDAMTEEANRLAKIGYQNMNERERASFNKLAETLTYENNKRDLLKLGAKEELLSDKSFNDFRKKFTSDTPIKDVYELYMQTRPKAKVENPGSMKNNDTGRFKDRYTEEEISKLSSEDLDDPKVWDTVMKSLTS